MSKRCNHLWQPMADAVKIWQVCQKCGVEEHVVTHAEQTRDMIHYVMTGTDRDTS